MGRECGTYEKKINMCWVLLEELEGEANVSMNALITQDILQKFHKL